MRKLLFCAATAGSLAAVPVQAAEPSATLLRAADAGRHMTYQGVVVYRGDDNAPFEVLKVQHRYRDGVENERMTSLTGEQRTLLRTGSHVVCILPKDHVVLDRPPVLKGLLSRLNAERLHELAQWYEFRDQGNSRIAGRNCDGVAMMPRDQYRYGFEFWSDHETGVPLKVSLIGQRGEVLEQVMFTQVGFPAAIADEVFAPDADSSRFKVVSSDIPAFDAQADPGLAQVSFQHLPPGFRVVARAERPLPGGANGKFEHLLMSDGLAAVSVFSEVEEHPDDKAGEQPAGKPFHGVSHIGAVEAYGRTIGTYQITIVGEVPPQTIRMIGDGAQPVYASGMPPTDKPAPPDPIH